MFLNDTESLRNTLNAPHGHQTEVPYPSHVREYMTSPLLSPHLFPLSPRPA